MSYGSYQSGDEFNRLTAKINHNIQKISTNVYNMQKIVNQIGTSSESESLRNQLRDTESMTRILVNTTSESIKELTNIPIPNTGAEQKQRKMLRERVTQDYFSVLKNFKVIQQTSMSKQKESLSRARAASNTRINPPVSKNLIEFQSPSVETSPFQAPKSDTQIQMENDINIEDLRTREAEINALEDNIRGVNKIFNDLAGIVHDQGLVIDSIEANIEDAHVFVTDAAQELQKASQYQRKARYKMFWLLIILITIIVIIALVIQYS